MGTDNNLNQFPKIFLSGSTPNSKGTIVFAFGTVVFVKP